MGQPIAVALAVAVALLAGCSGEPPDPYDDAAECNHLYTRGDPGLGAGYGYSEQPHPLGTPVPVVVCLGGRGGTVRLLAEGAGVTVTPDVGPVPDDRSTGLHQVTFEVTVERGASARLAVESDGMSYGGPTIRSDDDAGTWRLSGWGDRGFD